MRTYFHVDRRQRLTQGQRSSSSEFDLSHAPDLAQHLDILCPSGVSAHGRQYLNSDVKSGNGEAAIELIWEYVRRAHFPACPSRLISIFAWQSLEEADAFRVNSGLTDAKIWQIEAAAGFVANMSLLNIGTSVLRASQFAHAYWAGEAGPQVNGLTAPRWEVLLTGPITVVGEA